MAEPSTFPEEHTSVPLVYQRLSGFAIASFGLSIAFAVYLIGAAAWGFYDRHPVLLSPVFQAMPVVGAALSLVALLLIHRAEGTLAGRKLAIWSWWLCVVFGVGYAAYYGATYAAVRQQADRFATRWLNELRQGKFNAAFLLTVPPAGRKGINPEDQETLNVRFNQPRNVPGPRSQMGHLDQFLYSGMVRVFLQGGPETQVEAGGIHDWEFKNGAYKVKRSYRVKSPEGAYDFNVTAIGAESREYEGREWFISLSETRIDEPKTQLSGLGTSIKNLRTQSTRFIERWGNKLLPRARDLQGAYLDSRDSAQRSNLQTQYGLRVLGAGLAAGATVPYLMPGLPFLSLSTALDSELARRLYLSEYDSLFHRNEILKSANVRIDEPASRDLVIACVKSLFGLTSSELSVGGITVESSCANERWGSDNSGRVRLPHDCIISLNKGTNPLYTAIATIVVESDPGALGTGTSLNWRVIHVELKRVEPRRVMTPAGEGIG
jgi:hypothetical protein